MRENIRLLLNNLLVETSKGYIKGFIYVVGDKIYDVGEEPDPMYELSEYVNDFEGFSIALHGFSLLIDPAKYLLNILDGGNINDKLSTLTKDEIGKLVENTLYIMYRSGITLPIIMSKHLEVITRILLEKQLPSIIVDVEGTAPRYSGLNYLLVKNGKIYVDDEEIGNFNEKICSPDMISGKCSIISLLNSTSLPTATLSMIKDYKLLAEPYRIAKLDNGYLEKNGVSDIVIYDLREESSNQFYSMRPDRILEWGKMPDTVIVRGDIFFEKNESLVLEYHDLRSIVEKITS